MKLTVGNRIICFKSLDKNLTIGKSYCVMHTRGCTGDDICIIGDDGINWWFGQEDNTEPWTMWFVTKTQWREIKIELIMENEILVNLII